jgi:hypothetical protein
LCEGDARDVESGNPESIVRVIISLLDLSTLKSGIKLHDIKFNLTIKTSLFYLLIITKSLLVIDIKGGQDSQENNVVGNGYKDNFEDPLLVNKWGGDKAFYPTFIEKGDVINALKFYSSLFSTINKNYSPDTVFIKSIKIMQSLVKDRKLIQEIKRTSRNGSIKTFTFYKLDAKYQLSIINRLTLSSNIFPIRIIDRYQFSKSYQSFKVWSKPKSTQHSQNNFLSEPLEEVMGRPISIRISGTDLFYLISEFSQDLAHIDFLKGVKCLSSISDVSLNSAVSSIDLLLFKIHARLREEISLASIEEDNLQKKLNKARNVINREGLIKLCLESEDRGDSKIIKYMKRSVIDDMSTLDFNKGSIAALKSHIDSLSRDLDKITGKVGKVDGVDWEDFKMSIIDEIREKKSQYSKGSYDISLINHRVFFIEKLCLKKLIKFELDDAALDIMSRHKVAKKILGKLNSKYSLFISLLSLISLISRGTSKDLFYPMFKDFRGRIYSYCPTHPIYNRLIRPFIVLKSSLKYSEVRGSKYFDLISSLDFGSDFVADMKLSHSNNPNLMPFDIFLYFICVLSLEIFKFFKVDYLDLLEGGGIHIKDAIIVGFSRRSDSLYNCDKIDEKLYFSKMTESLNTLVSLGIIDDVTITRDSTASFIQHWSYLLGPVSSESLATLNLSGNNLSDLYIFSIKKIRGMLVKSADIDEGILELYDAIVTRKTIKKPIMTANYNVSTGKSLEYFDSDISIPDIPGFKFDSYTTKILSIHKAIRLFATNKMFVSLFKEDKEAYLSRLDSKFSTSPTYIKDSKKVVSVSYIYYKRGELKFKKVTNRGSGIKIQKYHLTNEVDLKKTKTALNANLLHSQDALLNDHLCYTVKCCPIHDSFSCSIFDLHLLMDEANYYFKDRLKSGGFVQGEYSAFILV